MSIARRATPVWAILFLVTAAYSGISWNTALSCVLTISVLVLAVRATKATGWSLVWMVFSIYFVTSWVNTMDEALLFQVVPPPVAYRNLAHGAMTSFTIAALLVLTMRRMQVVAESRNYSRPVIRGASGAWKLAVAAIVYILLYLAAGIAVHPFVATFYANKWLPPLPELCAIQFFRGLLYVAVALPFIWEMVGHRLRFGVMLGLCFAVLGGVAPLLLPNPYMPVPVRIAHTVEVGLSNFVFGLAVAFLIVTRRPLETSVPTVQRLDGSESPLRRIHNSRLGVPDNRMYNRP